jgi:hypothetical protein
MKISLRTFSAAAIASFSLAASGQTTAINSGSLGAAGDGTHAAGVTGVPGALAAAGDFAAFYDGIGAHHTQVPFNAALNPASSSPFTVEFWAKPAVDVNDALGPCPVFNRVTPGNRSGWIFYQRSPTTGWDFRMYNGSGSSFDLDAQGGSTLANTWSHVAAVWNGSSATLYVNGAVAATDSVGTYNASTSAILSLGTYDDGSNPFNGAVDEFAFYNSALTGAQIAAHFSAASSPTPGTYSSLVIGDGAVEYLRNLELVPEPSALSLIALGLVGSGALRRHLRRRE